MSDDIREVMRPTPFGNTRRVRRSFDKEPEPKKQDGQRADGEAAEEDAGGQAGEAALAEMEMEVRAANERLARAGRKVRLRLSRSGDAPVIEIIVPAGGAGGGGEMGGGAYGGAGTVVTRRIAPDEIAVWVVKLETAEGLIIDEKV